MRDPRPESAGASRRAFVKQAAAVAAASQLPLIGNAYAAGADGVLKVGLVGCGGRGTGAAVQALSADPNVKLVAMADAFPDQIQKSLSELKSSEVSSRIDVPQDRQYAGFDAYKSVIDQVDVVLLTTTPHFRPIHFAYAVEKGKHAFVEKPVATDMPGVRAFLKSCDDAKSKGLSVLAGLCWRYFLPRRELMEQVHEGKIGDFVAIETTYNSRGVWEPRLPRDKAKNEMECQMRNWYYYDWLSGDHIVEQAVHGIDSMAWAMREKPPIQCWGSGGRQVRVDPRYGNIWDHFAITYEYENGVRGYHHSRHWEGSDTQVKDYVIGTKGVADLFAPSPSIRVGDKRVWSSRAKKKDMYQHEHDEFFTSIREGKPKADGYFAAHSTILAIMGRTAAYTGQVITWDMIMNSQQNLGPAEYVWGDAPKRPSPVPGVTRFV